MGRGVLRFLFPTEGVRVSGCGIRGPPEGLEGRGRGAQRRWQTLRKGQDRPHGRSSAYSKGFQNGHIQQERDEEPFQS